MIDSYDKQMKEFIDAYRLILENAYPIKPEYMGMNMFKILNEWVESPDLIEFPKELQIELCKNIRKRHDNLSIISFKKIVEILEKYDYDYVDDVINGMKTFDALNRGCLVIISADVDENVNFIENGTLKFIKENFNDIYDIAYSIFSNLYNHRYADGLTVLHRDEFNPENTYNCIYLNRNASNMKDTLEHEVCHFIKNVAKSGNKFPKTYSGVTTNKIKSRQYECVVFLKDILKGLDFSDNALTLISEIAIRAFTDREEQPTIKSIVNAFIRRYEFDKDRYDINHASKRISQIEGIENKNDVLKFRFKWLDDFLQYVNSYQIFKDNKNHIEDYFSKSLREKDYEIDFLLKCMSYLCFKFQYPEYDIDEIIRENFKKFKFRDV